MRFISDNMFPITLSEDISLSFFYQFVSPSSEPMLNTPNGTGKGKGKHEFLDEKKDLLDGFFN